VEARHAGESRPNCRLGFVGAQRPVRRDRRGIELRRLIGWSQDAGQNSMDRNIFSAGKNHLVGTIAKMHPPEVVKEITYASAKSLLYLKEPLCLGEQQRAEWLASFRGKKPELAALLEALLNEHRALAEEGFLEQAPRLAPGQPAEVGQVVGAYRLLSPIGEGGMGTVWLAERGDDR